MKVGEDFSKPESSFLILEKDFARLTEKMLQNPRLLKLLYYREADALTRPNLTAQQKSELINKEIRIVPYLTIMKECPISIVIVANNFFPNANNHKFRDYTLNFHILCHPDHWNLGNFQLRPYKIAGELDAMFNNQKFTGIGELQFAGATNLVMNGQWEGLTLTYRSIQSTEDVIPIE